MKPRPIKSMEALLPDQLSQVAEWLQSGETFQKISARIQEEFGHTISVTSLHRFHQRLTIQHAEETRPELADAAVAEIRAQAATDRNLLAERNLALKFELAGIRYNYALNKESAVKPTPNIIPEWGPILRALEEENRRRNQPVADTNKPAAPAPSPASEPVNLAPEPIAPASSCPEPAVDLIETTIPEPQPVEPSTLPTPEESAAPNSDPAPEPADPIISKTPAVEPPSLPTPEEPTTQCEEPPGQTQSDPDSNVDEESSDPESRPHPRPNAPTLGERVHAYVHARRLEEIELRRTHPNSYYWTRYNCCPCGLKLPCPDHGHLPLDIASNTPDTSGFNDAMKKRFRTLKLDRILSRYTPYEYSE